MAFTLTPEMTFLLGVAVFWIVLYLIAYIFHLDKHGLDVKPAYFMYKSKALNNFLDRVANKRRSLWTVLSNIGLAFSIGLMAFSVYFLATNLVRFVTLLISPAEVVSIAPITPVIPVLTIRLYWLPYFFLAVAVIILSHELAHGIVARLEGIPVLSTGVLAFALFFGAFVEPDEKEFEKAPLLSRLRMLGAGSSTNLITALLATLLLTGLFVPASSGVLIQEVVPDGPADRAGLRQWDVIQAINGTRLYVYTDYYDYMANVTPQSLVNLTVLRSNRVENIPIITTKSSTNESRAALGILPSWFTPYRENRLGLDQYTGVNLYWALFWVYLLGISVAIFNMLPAFPFDGERVLYYPLASLVKKRKLELRWALSAVAWGILGLNIALTLLLMGLRSI